MNWNLTSRDIIRAIKKDNWEHVSTDGSHWQFKHPTKKGRVTWWVNASETWKYNELLQGFLDQYWEEKIAAYAAILFMSHAIKTSRTAIVLPSGGNAAVLAA